jgi:hypothetical protein
MAWVNGLDFEHQSYSMSGRRLTVTNERVPEGAMAMFGSSGTNFTASDTNAARYYTRQLKCQCKRRDRQILYRFHYFNTIYPTYSCRLHASSRGNAEVNQSHPYKITFQCQQSTGDVSISQLRM